MQKNSSLTKFLCLSLDHAALGRIRDDQIFSSLDPNMEQGKVRSRRVSVDSSCLYVHIYDNNKYEKQTIVRPTDLLKCCHTYLKPSLEETCPTTCDCLLLAVERTKQHDHGYRRVSLLFLLSFVIIVSTNLPLNATPILH